MGILLVTVFLVKVTRLLEFHGNQRKHIKPHISATKHHRDMQFFL